MHKYLCLLLAPLAWGQTPDARDLLLHAGDTELQAGSLRLEGRMSASVAGPAIHQTLENNFTLLVSGARYRLETLAPNTLDLQVDNGSEHWTYFSRNNTYSKLPGGRSQPHPLNVLSSGRNLATILTADIEREESLPFGGKPVDCFVVRATYSTSPVAPQSSDVTRTVWICSLDRKILRDVWEFSQSPNGPESRIASRIAYDYSVIEPGATLNDDLFVFHAPSGAKPLNDLATPTPAVLVRKIQPEYTPEARNAALQGAVSLYLEVAPGGRPSHIEVVSSLGMGLDERAVEAVKQWTYQPAPIVNGPQDALEIRVQFILNRPAAWGLVSVAFSLSDFRLRQVSHPTLDRYLAPDEAACTSPGSVVVTARIEKNGELKEIRAIRGDLATLGAAAVKAMEGWHFLPALASGKAVRTSAEVELACQPGGFTVSDTFTGPIYRVGGGVTAPSLVYKKEPQYSEEARRLKVQGSATIYLVILPNGRASNMHVIKRLGSGLDARAVQAIRGWQFKPGIKAGNPVAVEATIEVNFRLL